MTPAHLILALLVAVIWGIAFVVTKIGLESFSAGQLTAMRFLIAAAPALVLPRPPVSWSVLVALGSTLFTGQFLLQFLAIAGGTPPGLASVLIQTQALFTILFAAVALRERPSGRQLAGPAVACTGLAAIASTTGHDLTVAGLGLTLGAAISWGIGNILMKRVGRVDMLPLVAWLSLVPPLPSLALSTIVDATALPQAVSRASWLGLAAAIYLGVVATVLAYAIWGDLLRRYSAATVAPFALLVPVVGASASFLVLGERFGPLRVSGMALVLVGLGVIVWPANGAARSKSSADAILGR